MDERTDERTNEWVKCTCKNKLKMNENSISCSRSKKVERSVINYCNIYSDSFLIFDVLQTELSITVDDMIKNNLSSKTVRIPWIFVSLLFKTFMISQLFICFENKKTNAELNQCSNAVNFHPFVQCSTQEKEKVQHPLKLCEHIT